MLYGTLAIVVVTFFQKLYAGVFKDTPITAIFFFLIAFGLLLVTALWLCEQVLKIREKGSSRSLVLFRVVTCSAGIAFVFLILFVTRYSFVQANVSVEQRDQESELQTVVRFDRWTGKVAFMQVTQRGSHLIVEWVDSVPR